MINALCRLKKFFQNISYIVYIIQLFCINGTLSFKIRRGGLSQKLAVGDITCNMYNIHAESRFKQLYMLNRNDILT